MTLHTAAPPASARSVAARFIAAVTIAGALVAGSLLAGSVLAGSSLAGSAAASTPVSGFPEVTAGLDYVALGDSYSAGLGLTPPTGLPTPQCGQSAVNFPHQVAAAYGLELTDVSCAGAETANITTTAQYADAPVQVSALSTTTDIVTITIGGNDVGFAAVAAACTAASPVGPLLADPTLPNCAAHYTKGGDSLANLIAGPVSAGLAASYAQIAATAPNAEVFVVGYPSIFPAVIPEAGCFSDAQSGPNAFPFTTIDTSYLRSVEEELDAAIQTAAANAGFTYVPTFGPSADNSVCTPAGTAYVNGVTLTEAGSEPSSLHPNTLGETFLTDSLSAAIDATFPSGAAAPTTSPGVDGPLLVGSLAGVVLLIAAVAFVTLRRRRGGER